MKYIVRYTNNAFESNSRNVRRHIRELDEDYVRVENKYGEFICEGARNWDGTVNVITRERYGWIWG